MTSPTDTLLKLVIDPAIENYKFTLDNQRMVKIHGMCEHTSIGEAISGLQFQWMTYTISTKLWYIAVEAGAGLSQHAFEDHDTMGLLLHCLLAGKETESTQVKMGIWGLTRMAYASILYAYENMIVSIVRIKLSKPDYIKPQDFNQYHKDIDSCTFSGANQLLYSRNVREYFAIRNSLAHGNIQDNSASKSLQTTVIEIAKKLGIRTDDNILHIFPKDIQAMSKAMQDVIQRFVEEYVKHHKQ